VRWKDDLGKIHGSWIAIRGPVETKINFIQKNGISVDNPNHTLNILMTKDEETLKYFKRYAKFYISNSDAETNKICWRVSAVDTISMPGVMEITAIEYYANESEDDDGLVGSLIVTPAEPNGSQNLIKGETYIKPKKVYEFIYEGEEEAEWIVDTKVPLNATPNGRQISISWPKTYSGEFTLRYGSTSRKVIVESLF